MMFLFVSWSVATTMAMKQTGANDRKRVWPRHGYRRQNYRKLSNFK
jgi:hypothetical protein